MKVSVAVALADRQEVVELELAAGSRVADALAAARVFERHPQLAQDVVAVGIWSKACGRDAELREGDRVEVYRALRADPKSQRRDRARVKPSTRPRNAP